MNVTLLDTQVCLDDDTAPFYYYQGIKVDVSSVSEWSIMEKSTANKAASTGRLSTYKFRLFIEGNLFGMVHL